MTQPFAVQPVEASSAIPFPDSGTHPTGQAADVAAAEVSGHSVVDEVLRSLDGVDARPLGEQVQVFEAAHARLHAVLDDAGDDPTA